MATTISTTVIGKDVSDLSGDLTRVTKCWCIVELTRKRSHISAHLTAAAKLSRELKTLKFTQDLTLLKNLTNATSPAASKATATQVIASNTVVHIRTTNLTCVKYPGV